MQKEFWSSYGNYSLRLGYNQNFFKDINSAKKSTSMIIVRNHKLFFCCNTVFSEEGKTGTKKQTGTCNNGNNALCTAKTGLEILILQTILLPFLSVDRVSISKGRWPEIGDADLNPSLSQHTLYVILLG